MVAQVVVGDAGVGVDHLRRAMRVFRVDLRGHQHRAVAERPRVEDRRDVADDPMVDQALGPREHLVLRHTGRLGDAGVRAGREREAPLQQVEQSLVDVVQRDRRPVGAAAHLRAGPGQRSHSAASLAW